MSPKPVIPRQRAQQDVDEALDHYLRDANGFVALGFVDDLQATYRLIAEHPASGSPRYAYELQMADLRSLRLKRYPYLVFYVEHPDHIEVWRVLHGMRDIPSWLIGPDGDRAED